MRVIERKNHTKNMVPKKTTHLVSHKAHFVLIFDMGIFRITNMIEVGIQTIKA